ncbi:MAG TPA: YjbE family putative metal transport protein [Methanosarcina sp.]|nr:YjbE family putative metal transport protein [Methanosarcina sp.]
MEQFASFFMSIEWLALVKIILLDIVLGGDNAIVIAIACEGVPAAYHRRAIIGGTVAAIVMRLVVLAFAAVLIKYTIIKALAGAALFVIGYKLLAEQGEDHNVSPQDKMWAAIKTIAIADLMMSVDNVFAVTGAAQETGAMAEWYAMAGVLVSIPIIVFFADLLSYWIDKFPIITTIGGGLLGWVGTEMILSTSNLPHSLVKIACLVGAAILVYVGNRGYQANLANAAAPSTTLKLE